ncbi:TlpA disulfide reductase family protein [Flavobacterium caeni]|uniref:Peroxiredoxin n=1 Tax=Flavobacterium caeni TaxID=490189 RepID=A0A1G5JXL1_9FLAO|nr:TlpA disulfide reductase family protein [Flavobacterium caeni]SCY93057.1 Peroxiredoxin [Flavobacterium caeni]
MKKVLMLVSAVAVMVSCNKAGDNEYLVTGTVKDIKDGTNVFIEKQDSIGRIVAIDTVKIEKGKFTFKGSATEPAIHMVQVESLMGKVPFILENGEIEIAIDKDSIQKSVVSGTYNNDELTNFKAEGMKIQKTMMKFQQDNMMKMQQAQQAQDTATMNGLRKEFNKLQEGFMKQSEDYVGSHPKAFISALIVDGMFNQMAPDLEKIKKHFAQLDKSLQEGTVGKGIAKKIKAIENPTPPASQSGSAPAVGSVAPDFSAKNPDGKPVSLKESLGKVTIIDFWASWCKPCRAENPNVVALYNELHGKGLNIIGVSLDKEAGAWKDAIAKDKLTWNQISNLQYWDEPIAKTYGVESIPATFILDASGKIVAKDLRGDALKAKVNELLAAK